MSSGIVITKSIKSCSDAGTWLKKAVEAADCILIGAGAGLSAAAGMAYEGERFEEAFGDFHKTYGITDMYSGGFYPYDTYEEYWAWWSRHILINRYTAGVGKPYTDLLKLVRRKDYFVLTTNVDHQFQLAGFDKQRLFYTQGDYGLWQCAKACHDQTYENETSVRRMVASQVDMKIPTDLIPKCPVCGAPMCMNLRCDERFVQDAGWYAAARRYDTYLRQHKDRQILFLELGVGYNTPGIIKYPFWNMVSENPKAMYIGINQDKLFVPNQIQDRSLGICGDLAVVLRHAVS